MDNKVNYHEMQIVVFDAFKSQIPELFDVAFEISGKVLYAEKEKLSAISPTFEIMLSERWMKNDEPVKIKSHNFEDFKECLTFIYYNKCELTNENIFSMVDLAEFYQITALKTFCDEYLSKMQYNLENVFQMLKLSNIYYLIHLKTLLRKYIFNNFFEVISINKIITLEKCVIEELLILLNNCTISKQQILFQVIFDWVENQALSKQNEPSKLDINKNELIKAEMSDFLRYFQFNKMRLNYLKNFVVEKNFLFTDEKLTNILRCAHSNHLISVKVTNSIGQSIYGTCKKNNPAVETIKSLKDVLSKNCLKNTIFWTTKCKIPSKPSLIKKRTDVIWYLTYFFNGYIGILRRENIFPKDDYILAEMIAEGDFCISRECKIEIEE